MKVEKLIANNQPSNWYETVTRECAGYPIDKVDIQKDELVLDIGANVGGFWNAWKWRFDNWHLVEPSVYNCEQIRLNGYDGSYSRNAVAKRSGEVVKLQKYWGDGDNDTLSGNFGTLQFVNDGNGHGWKGDYEEVVTISFEDLIRDREVGLLKIDCEGAEFDFLYNKDLSKVKYIVGEFHNFLFQFDDRGVTLLEHIRETHDEIYSEGDGINSHYVKLYKRK
jgi:FkbM family methyltransferase